VLEDLDISTLAITPATCTSATLPIRTSPGTRRAKATHRSMTRIHAKGVQLALKDVSFYYHDNTATIGLSEVSGILELTMLPEGLEFVLKVRRPPNTVNAVADIPSD
jgi:hypothetical protein